MIFNLINDEKHDSSIIKVIGVGGGGSNAVNNMFRKGIVGVDFAICNTDAQAMDDSPIPIKIQLGPTLTEGRGAGSKPNVGKLACEESIDDISNYLNNDCKMLFITAGMGGGTGTGAAPIIAKKAQEMDILTIGIVTMPFSFEGKKRVDFGITGVDELKKNVDSLIVISNDKLRDIYGNMGMREAFAKADDILTMAAKGIAEIITKSGYVNVDFEDVNTVMRGSGSAVMGTGTGSGEDRAKTAIDEALSSPLLEENNIRGSKHILLNIVSGKKEITFDEISVITDFVQQEAGLDTNLIWGSSFDENLDDEIMVTIIATGFEGHKQKKERGTLETQVRVRLDGDQSSRLDDITGESVEQSAKKNTFEFDDVRDTIEQMRANRSAPEGDISLEAHNLEIRRKMEADRRKKEFRDQLNVKLDKKGVINQLEKEPAYLRRGVHLDDVPRSSEPYLSQWHVGADDEPDLVKKNKFLHKDID